MRIEKTDFEGLLRIFPDVHRDDRGLFAELWQAARYEDLWPELSFVQDNFSVSKKSASTRQEYSIRIKTLKEKSGLLAFFTSNGIVVTSGILISD